MGQFKPYIIWWCQSRWTRFTIVCRRTERVYRILKMLVRDWINLFWNVHRFIWKDYLIGPAFFAQQKVKSQKNQEEKTSKQKQNMYPFLEMKAINSVFLTGNSLYKNWLLHSNKKKYVRSKNKINISFV